jgi:hypothetical protein
LNTFLYSELNFSFNSRYSRGFAGKKLPKTSKLPPPPPPPPPPLLLLLLLLLLPHGPQFTIVLLN